MEKKTTGAKDSASISLLWLRRYDLFVCWLLAVSKPGFRNWVPKIDSCKISGRPIF